MILTFDDAVVMYCRYCDVKLPGVLPMNKYGRLDAKGHQHAKLYLKNDDDDFLRLSNTFVIRYFVP